MFADDSVIITDFKEIVQARVLQWQENLQKERLKVKAQKSEVTVRRDFHVRDMRREDV